MRSSPLPKKRRHSLGPKQDGQDSIDIEDNINDDTELNDDNVNDDTVNDDTVNHDNLNDDTFNEDNVNDDNHWGILSGGTKQALQESFL